MENILAYSIAGNSLENILVALAVLLTMWLGFYLFKRYVVRRLKKATHDSRHKIARFITIAARSVTSPFYFVVSLAIAAQFVELGETPTKILSAVIMIAVVVQCIRTAQSLLAAFLDSLTKEGSITNQQAARGTFLGVQFIAKLALWSIGLLLVLSNLGFNVSSLVTSLGIGGVAVALATQNILGDIFSSFSIYFDRPFEIGDLITVGANTGTVKNIGLKTTRIQSLQGEELVISNRELTNTRIQNFKKMEKRRVLLSIGLTYQTSLDRLKMANEIIKSAILGSGQVQFERCHFKEFGASSLNFEAVYFVLSSDFNHYMDCQQAINFRIKEEFEKAGLDIAYPTQTVLFGNAPSATPSSV